MRKQLEKYKLYEYDEAMEITDRELSEAPFVRIGVAGGNFAPIQTSHMTAEQQIAAFDGLKIQYTYTTHESIPIFHVAQYPAGRGLSDYFDCTFIQPLYQEDPCWWVTCKGYPRDHGGEVVDYDEWRKQKDDQEALEDDGTPLHDRHDNSEPDDGYDEERTQALEKHRFIGAHAMVTSREMHNFMHKHRHELAGLPKHVHADRE